MSSFVKYVLCLVGCIGFTPLGADQNAFGSDLCGSWRYMDFDVSMQRNRHSVFLTETKKWIGIEGRVLYDFFKDLYERNNLTMLEPDKETRIPKIIHVIWLGSPLPNVLKPYVNSWKEKHPDWEFRFWDDEAVKGVTMYNQELYDKATNAGMKSDILRLELLNQFGGVYVDTDFECLQPLDIFHHTYDFYAGLQPLDSGLIQSANAICGAKPGHPVIQHCMKHIRKTFYKSKWLLCQTGPIPFTRVVYAAAGMNGNRDCVFPASYFFPLGSRQEEIKKDQWKKWGSFGVHWWAKTWNDPEDRSEKFQCIDNRDQL